MKLRLLFKLIILRFRIKRREIGLDTLFKDEMLQKKYLYKPYWTKEKPEGDCYDILQTVLNKAEDWRGEKEGYLTLISKERNSRRHGFLTATFPLADFMRVSIVFDWGKETGLEILTVNENGEMESAHTIAIRSDGNAIYKSPDGTRGYALRAQG